MSLTPLPFQLALLVIWCSFFLIVPSATALPLPFSISIPKPHTCLTFDSPVDITSPKLSDGAVCILYPYVSRPLAQPSLVAQANQPRPKHRQALTRSFCPNSAPLCTGSPTISAPSTPPYPLNHKIASLFCKSSKTFTTTDFREAHHDEDASGREDFRNDLRRSNPIRNRRSNDKGGDIPPQPCAEAIQAGTENARLTPWKPPVSSGPPKESEWCGGDGPYYANANGCIGPG